MPRPLSPTGQQQLVETALQLLETLYVHLPLKRSMYAINPLQKLKLLRQRLEPDRPRLGDAELFYEMLAVFCQLRDLHTTFVMPEPLRSSTAFLPFHLEKYFEPRSPRQPVFVVSRLTPGFPTADPDFQRGAIVTHWNGTPIHRAVAANAEREAGSNPAARLAQGLAALTMRWLGHSLVPEEDWVDVRYLPKPGAKAKTVRFEWQIFRRKASSAGGEKAIARAQGHGLLAVGMDARGESDRQVRRRLFDETGEEGPPAEGESGSAVRAAPWALEVFPRSEKVITTAGEFAYVRIATFNVDDEKRYLREFIRLVSALPQTGLILDVRGNGGGLIYFGERLLQLLTPQPIEPARFSFLNSACSQQITKNPAFKPWRNSIAQWVETGTEYSQGFPLLDPAKYNAIGQKYQGPVVLVTDALCYSTTDIFAAGFQDHGIGVVLGVDNNTGAGGANVWEYERIAELFGDTRRFPLKLPGSASFRFAVRRVTRVKERSGALLEDLGVQPDEIHQVTRRDVLERNVDLIEHAGTILARSAQQRLTCEWRGRTGVRITYRNLDRIDTYLGNRPFQGGMAVVRSDEEKEKTLAFGRAVLVAGAGARVGAVRELRLEGFRCNAQGKEELVAATRLRLPKVGKTGGTGCARGRARGVGRGGGGGAHAARIRPPAEKFGAEGWVVGIIPRFHLEIRSRLAGVFRALRGSVGRNGSKGKGSPTTAHTASQRTTRKPLEKFHNYIAKPTQTR